MSVFISKSIFSLCSFAALCLSVGNAAAAEPAPQSPYLELLRQQEPYFNKAGSVLPERYTFGASRVAANARVPNKPTISPSPATSPAPISANRNNVPYLTIAAGVYDFYRHPGRKRDRQGEYRIEYRGREILGPVKPFASFAFTYCPGSIEACPGKNTTASVWLGGGGLIDFEVFDNVFLTPSLGLMYYQGGTSDLDLDSPLMGRAQMEVAYRFEGNSRLGLGLSHYDNMGTGKTNPGTETLTLNYSIPLGD